MSMWPKMRTLSKFWRRMCPKVGTPFLIFVKSANPSNNLFECAGQRQNFEPFWRNWHQKCSTPRSTKKMYFCDGFMKAKCNKNGRHIFNVFAWCRLWSKTTNPLRPSQKCRKMRTVSNKCQKIQKKLSFCHGRVQKCEPFGAFWQGRTQKCEPFCESSPKVRTVLKFWRACAQKMRTLSRVWRGMCPKVSTFRKLW